jgi:hypothetical protein
LPRAIIHNLCKSIREIGYNIPLYNQRLKGRHPLKLIRKYENPLIGNPLVGADVIEDKLLFSGHLIEKAGDFSKMN